MYLLTGFIGEGVYMETPILHNINANNRQRYLEQRDINSFSRVVEGNYEIVKYLSNSSIRIWYNVENSDFSAHWHPAIEIIMPLENIYTVETSSENFILNPGDILLIPSGELHHLVAPESGARLIYLFDISVISKLGSFSYLIPFLSQPILINEKICPQIYREEASILEKIFTEYMNDTNLWEMLVYSQFLNFLATYGRYRLSSDDSLPYAHADKQKELINKLNIVFSYIDEHYMDDITLEKVADVAGFSKFHFSRLFKQCSGQNFYDYLCFKRIKAAEMLLLEPGLSITEIALQSGFSSLSTFNRTFKKQKNCTPSEYRSLCSKNPKTHNLKVE
jgi:AraC-like DNA-binding protein